MTPKEKIAVAEMMKTKGFELFIKDIEDYCQDRIMVKFSLNKLNDMDLHDLHTDNKALMLIQESIQTHANYTQADYEVEIEQLKETTEGED